MKAEQQTIIRNYLLSKKLPLDILIEVQDHFENQVSSLMQDKDQNFETAFLQTQVLWTHELQMVRKSWFSFSKVPALVKKIQSECNRELSKKTFTSAAASTLIMLLAALFLPKEIFIPINAAAFAVMSISVFFIVLFLVISSVGKRSTRASRYIYQNMLRLFSFYILLSTFGAMRSLPTNTFQIIHDFANAGFSFGPEVYIVMLFHTFFFQFVFFYMIFVLTDYRRAAKKIKLYLAQL